MTARAPRDLATNMEAAMRFTPKAWSRRMRLAVISLGALGAALLMGTVHSQQASAKSPIEFFSTTASSQQAGGHPDIFVEFVAGNRASQGYNKPCFCNDPKEVKVSLPPA